MITISSNRWGRAEDLVEATPAGVNLNSAIALYFTVGAVFAACPVLSLLLLKVAIWQPFAWSFVFLAIAVSSPEHIGPGAIPPMLAWCISTGAVMYWVDQTSRAQFLLHLKEIRHTNELAAAHEATRKADYERLAALDAAKEADNEAFSAINHCAKRVMYNSLQWSDDLDGHVTPDLKSGEQPKVEKAIKDLEMITKALKSDNQKGFVKCRTAIALKQIAAGTYIPVPESVEIRAWMKDRTGLPNMYLSIADDVPDFVSLPVVNVESILDNAISNAATHGQYNVRITVEVASTDGDFLTIFIHNQPGARHDEALKIQDNYGESAVLRGPTVHAMSSVGSASSTFLGGGEMAACAATANQDATVSLVFKPDGVTFTLRMKLVLGNASKTNVDDGPRLKDGAFLICADDDLALRMGYKGLSKKLGVPLDHLLVLGETFEEVARLKDTVLEAAG